LMQTLPSSQPDSMDFMHIISDKITELEKGLAGANNQGEREVIKARKRSLHEVKKYCSDKSNSLEDRLTFLQTKFAQQAQELLKLERSHQEVLVQLDMAVKEKERAQDGLRKANAMRDKLEELCRQLQKENKEVMEEARKLREDDASARGALQQRFQSAINDVTTKMDAQAAERATQLTENDALRGKLSDVLAQFETFNQLVHKKDLETQLAQARLEQQAAVCEAMGRKAELLEQANSQLLEAHKAASVELETLVDARRVNAALGAANRDLKEQLDMYHAKFTEFQGTLTKSNAMFAGLKKELDAGVKLRAALVKERDELRQRCEGSSKQMVELLEDKQALLKQVKLLSAQVQAVEGMDAEEVRKLKGQKDALEALCRTLSLQVKASKVAAGPNSQQGGSPVMPTEPGSPCSPARQDKGHEPGQPLNQGEGPSVQDGQKGLQGQVSPSQQQTGQGREGPAAECPRGNNTQFGGVLLPMPPVLAVASGMGSVDVD